MTENNSTPMSLWHQFKLNVGCCKDDSTPSRKPLFANRFPATDIAKHKKTAPALFLPVAV
ncbi:hypothetical protein [Rhizobium nepotum]|uniref:hypothetical protein n=1 Tax=Rhizobium nepotum TaxID=1035271 RepID=UPI000AEF4E65|nr:hypothetical protein [Rhizobium nepotum]